MILVSCSLSSGISTGQQSESKSIEQQLDSFVVSQQLSSSVSALPQQIALELVIIVAKKLFEQQQVLKLEMLIELKKISNAKARLVYEIVLLRIKQIYK